MGLLTVVVGVSDSFALSWDSFPHWVAYFPFTARAFALSYCVLFCCVVCFLLEDSSFLKGDGRGLDLEERGDRGDLGGVGGGQTVLEMYYVREDLFKQKDSRYYESDRKISSCVT